MGLHRAGNYVGNYVVCFRRSDPIGRAAQPSDGTSPEEHAQQPRKFDEGRVAALPNVVVHKDGADRARRVAQAW